MKNWRINCGKCYRRVDSSIATFDGPIDLWSLTVKCHGEEKTVKITKSYIDECADDFEVYAFGEPDVKVDVLYGYKILNLNQITREAIRLFNNSSAFLKNIDMEYDDTFLKLGSKVRGSAVKIKLPKDFGVINK